MVASSRSQNRGINGAHRRVREEWLAIYFLEKLNKIFHIFFYRNNFEDKRSFMVTTEKNSVNVYCIQVFNYQGQYTVSIPSPEGAWGGRSLRVKSAVSAIRDLDVCPAGVPNVNLETGSNVLVCGKNNITAELDVIRHLESCSQLCWGCYVFSHRKSRLAVFQRAESSFF